MADLVQEAGTASASKGTLKITKHYAWANTLVTLLHADPTLPTDTVKLYLTDAHIYALNHVPFRLSTVKLGGLLLALELTPPDVLPSAKSCGNAAIKVVVASDARWCIP
jgi:hypothetical protein